MTPMKFNEIKNETPRLVVLFTPKEDGTEQFKWGMVGKIPILTLLGSLVRIQSELFFKAGGECPEKAFVMVWDDETRKMEWFIHPDIPLDPLAGMVDRIRMDYHTQQAAYEAMRAGHGGQTMILGPDGRPIGS